MNVVKNIDEVDFNSQPMDSSAHPHQLTTCCYWLILYIEYVESFSDNFVSNFVCKLRSDPPGEKQVRINRLSLSFCLDLNFTVLSQNLLHEVFCLVYIHNHTVWSILYEPDLVLKNKIQAYDR